jgi:hypothetical protein
MTAAYIRDLLEHGIATQAEWGQICELAIAHLDAAAVPPAPAPLPQLGKGVNPIYFVSLAEMFRTNDNWIIFQFREGGTIRVPIHEDHNCVLAEPERH